jgi:Aerotolerance regulator N-terminal
MEMSLLHAGLAAGAALAALPVILHLFMRQTPKHVIFPALRLVRERQKQSKKRMRIKNWLLLLARMAILALMALALARPRLYTEVPLGDDSVPTALGLVFDTSLSMDYKEKDKTRLDEAKERAREIIDKLPDSSLVFVVDSALPGVPIGLPPSAALKVISDLKTHPVNRPLNAAMGQVYAAVAECDRPVHVVYVLTDLARTSWSPDLPAEGLDHVAKIKVGKSGKLVTFILRLTPEHIQNVSVDSAEPPSSEVAQGDSIEVRARIRAQGATTTTRTVEFKLDGVKKGEQTVEIPPPIGEKEVTFVTPSRLELGVVHRGEVRLSGAPDPLEIDDKRFFTFKVRPPLKVLILSDRPFDAEFVADALEPELSAAPSSFLVEKGLASDFSSRYKSRLDTYSCVFLLNVKQLEEAEWGALNGYVRQGGGLVVGLGRLCLPGNYNNAIASQLLPAQLEDHPKNPRADTTFGKVVDITHPLFGRYGKAFDGMLAQVSVYNYWPVKTDGVDGTRTLVSFADGAPALLERSFKGAKTGRVLLWTTPLDRRAVTFNAAHRDPDVWNEFPVQSWAFLVLMNLTVPYMAGSASEPLNFEAGQNVLLTLEPNIHYSNFTVTGPDEKTTERLIPSPSREVLEIDSPQAIGQWTVKATGVDKSVTTFGFSLNSPRSESKFEPLEKSDLDVIFGKEGYLLAEDAQSQDRQHAFVTFGHEVFPWLMFLILIVVTLENFLANTFYKEKPKAKV